MSRWQEVFDDHQIHETLRQTREWASTEFEEIEHQREIERARLLKVFDLVDRSVSGLDPELFPRNQVDELNGILRNQRFWNQLSSFSTSGHSNYLTTANDHISAYLHLIFKLNNGSNDPSGADIIKSMEKSFERILMKIETTQKTFSETASASGLSLEALANQQSELATSFETLTNSTRDQLSTWQTEFTDAQTSRSEAFSASQNERAEQFSRDQVGRTTHFEAEVQDFHTKFNEDREQTVSSQTSNFSQAFEDFKKLISDKREDAKKKHEEILTIHGLVAKDGVVGGYKSGADQEKKFAFGWSIASMVCYGLILLWVVAKGKLGFGIAQGETINWPIVATTLSVTAVAFVAAQYAGKQSRIHRINEQRMRWFSFEIEAIDPFISSLPIEMQQDLKRELSERLFGQERVVDDIQKKSSSLDSEALKSVAGSLTEALKSATRNG